MTRTPSVRDALPMGAAVLIVCAVLANLAGCLTTPTPLRPDSWWHSLAPARSEPGQVVNLGALDVIASLAALAAAALLVLWALGAKVPPRASAAAIITAVAAWSLKFMLVRYLWLIAILALTALVLFAIALYRANSPSILGALRLGHRRDVPPDHP